MNLKSEHQNYLWTQAKTYPFKNIRTKWSGKLGTENFRFLVLKKKTKHSKY